jgi:circadian clock protein KaiB
MELEMGTEPRKPTRSQAKAAKPKPKGGGTAAGKEKVVRYVLCLYVVGRTPKSAAAIANLEKICEEHLSKRYKLRVVDLLENPTLARGDQIIAVPTLVRQLPLPVRKIIGDLSNTERVLSGLALGEHKKVGTPT